MAEHPKQLLLLKEKPVLIHVFEAFLSYARDIRFVLVLPEAWHKEWSRLCSHHRLFVQHTLTGSGPTRFHSVKSGLKHIPDEGLVAIHDGVRPVVSRDLISRVFQYAERFGNAIPVVTPADSVRLTDHGLSSPLSREKVRLVQTPQCFRADKIKQAYAQPYRESFTDDATVLESTGERLFLVEGEKENIKITTPPDLLVAQALLSP